MLEENTQLINEIEINIRFSETDALGMVWHGNYLKYMEDGRVAWGNQFGLGYLESYEKGWLMPIVSSELKHKKTVHFGDAIIVKTTLINCLAAKLIFKYDMFRKSDMSLVCQAKTVQVFMDKNHDLALYSPEFFKLWKREKRLN